MGPRTGYTTAVIAAHPHSPPSDAVRKRPDTVIDQIRVVEPRVRRCSCSGPRRLTMRIQAWASSLDYEITQFVEIAFPLTKIVSEGTVPFATEEFNLHQ